MNLFVKRPLLFCLILVFISHFGSAKNVNNTPIDKLTKSKILVYTKNGKGYVHDNIAASVKCIQ